MNITDQNNSDYNFSDLITALPHRYPFLLIDRIISIDDKSIVAIKNVTINEDFFAGHFPNMPVMPGVLILESLMQAGAILAYKNNLGVKKQEMNVQNLDVNDRPLYVVAGIENARFKKIVTPGDQLLLTVHIIKGRQNIWKIGGKATVDGNVACTAEFVTALKARTNEK